MTQREEIISLRSLLIRWRAATEDSTDDEVVRRLANETEDAISVGDGPAESGSEDDNPRFADWGG
jgi:hypothetical protein